MIRFPYGNAALSLLVIALVTGGYLFVNRPPKRTATITYWTFAKPHYEAYLKAVPAWEKAHPGATVDLQLVAGNGLPQRLQSAFQADLDVPDMVEVEISAAGSFFRGPQDQIGFEDLTARLKADGLMEKMVAARFAPYTRRGRVYGLPHDVHPVMLAYRRDLFDEAGIHPESIETWDDFIAIGKRVSKPSKRYLLEMSDSGRDQIEPCLFQRGGGYFDKEGNLIFDNEIAVKTMCWYVPLVAGSSKSKIANNLSSSYGQVIAQAMTDGYFLALVCPDWRSKSIENDIGAVKGKMALMPFPAVEKGGKRTTTWGGTMLGITKACKNKDLAWSLAKHFYLNEKDLAGRFDDTNILPPVRAAWKEPAFDKKREFWSNQSLGRLYANLAPDVPFQYTDPYIELAKNKFSEAVIASVSRYNEQGETGFEKFVRQTLKAKAAEVRRQMARNPF